MICVCGVSLLFFLTEFCFSPCLVSGVCVCVCVCVCRGKQMGLAHISALVVKSGFYPFSKAGWEIGPGHWWEELLFCRPTSVWG